MIFIFNIKTDSKVKIIVKFFSKKRKKKGKKEREREKKVNSYRTFKEYLQLNYQEQNILY